jgi:integral membrane protein (TIGR01906 family)
MKMRLYQMISWIISLLVPIILLISSVRLLLSPWFPSLEYRTPNFPSDPYGFTLADRLKWSEPSVRYLTNSAGLEYLRELEFPDGSSIYNERELSHMDDVKQVVQGMLKAWLIGLAVLLATGVWAWKGGWLNVFKKALSRGGWITIGLILAILAAVVISFDWLFTSFHKIFFQGDTWLFYYSDTLIRLFPIRFWQDCFIFIGVISLVSGLLLGILLKERQSKS